MKIVLHISPFSYETEFSLLDLVLCKHIMSL
jgi:hypothetical protein